MTLPEDTPLGQPFDEDHHPRQRKSDQGLPFWGGWLYRHLVPAIAIVIAALALSQTQGKIDRQQEGRSIAIDVLCGFGNGVAEAGRKALAGKLEGQHSANGLPDVAQRDYVATITSTLLSEAGISAQNVVQPNGEVNCARLRVAARATHP